MLLSFPHGTAQPTPAAAFFTEGIDLPALLCEARENDTRPPRVTVTGDEPVTVECHRNGECTVLHAGGLEK